MKKKLLLVILLGIILFSAAGCSKFWLAVLYGFAMSGDNLQMQQQLNTIKNKQWYLEQKLRNQQFEQEIRRQQEWNRRWLNQY